ncbi:MAG: hypothetical protein MR020_05395 [Lachnospiraceae bacterium]|nr:hypothetical protein [Lachnospiraceae bacterium]
MNTKKKWKKTCLMLLLILTMLFPAGCGKESLTDVFGLAGIGSGKGDVSCVSGDRYVHNTLSEKQQLVYDEMLHAIINMQENVRLSTTDTEDVKRCYHAICADYGEIFWVDSCSYTEILLFGRPCAVNFTISYAYTPEEVADYRAQMQPVIDEYLERLAACESDYEKTEVLYRKLICEVAYDMSADNNQNILSVFLGKKTVCQGYACAVQYLLQQAGVPCVIITGIAQGQPHAWNMVLLDGDYYYLDATWGNTDFLGESSIAAGSVNYGYLNITSDELFVNHQPQVDFPLVNCDSREANYYVKNKLYFDSWDADAIGAKLSRGFEEKEDSVSLKFADGELLVQAKTYFIDDKHITDYCEKISRIYYVQDEDLHILTIYF